MTPNYAVRTVAIVTLGFLILPVIIVIPMSFSSASSMSFPPPGLSLRWYSSFFGSSVWVSATITSAVLALISSTLGLLLGSMASYGLCRRRIMQRGIIESNFMAPMILPTIITAVALYIAFAKIGLLGTLIGLVMAHTILLVPYVMVVMNVAFRSFDLRQEQVSWTMGASWYTTMRRVVLPQLGPNLFAAWVFAFVHSFDEVVVTSFIAGTYNTVPKQMFSELILEISPTITAVATLLIAFTVASLAGATLIMKRSVQTV
ncbi:ABC transporter permease [Phyllobacterium endophyticum]|uniref:ABC transporter permease n=1 Tax=Phyllobacterium endophyticum TaxID=1149773 RepID=A0A2P7AKE3_9HYPH|nr:ABC transporter permease [Phyllobacterium endophyticum]MBB3237094.1 ABC-type spermidine/putrescine transport system permease subunit II [Phyllobacterium endophyticum]PSH54670.1 ABC transporter permease [Phyllobacterium endophyticum]TYR40563.1 ABC transporter permease [Phyllobacterium endophyticum]